MGEPIRQAQGEAGSGRLGALRDDWAYILPIAVFLLLTLVGGWWPGLYVASYVVKTAVVGGMLVVLWGHYTRIRWDYWWLGMIAGVAGVVQWVGMETALLTYWPNYPRMEAGEAFVPGEYFATTAWLWGFVVIRLAGAVLVVPVMEELFWRDFLWRTIIAPNDFKLAEVGEWDVKAFAVVALVFGAAVHIEWMTAIVYGLMIGGLLVYTKSLGACIIAHAVTNLLLGLYVLRYEAWGFW